MVDGVEKTGLIKGPLFEGALYRGTGVTTQLEYGVVWPLLALGM